MKTVLKIVCLNFIVFAIAALFLLPTHDDWGYCASPRTTPFEWSSLLPQNYWRPFDVLFGRILTIFPFSFPIANHFFIVIGHLLNAWVLYAIMGVLRYTKEARLVSVALFMILPATLGTVLGIDSLNQVYSCFWGLLSVLLCVKYDKAYWLIAALFAVFCKENGMVYFVLAPAFEYSFVKKDDLRKALIKVGCGMLCVIVWFIARFSLETQALTISEDSPYAFTLKNKLTDLASFIMGTPTVIDCISLIHQPSRNLIIVVLTTLISGLFLYYIFLNKKIKSKDSLIIISMCVVVASPHLATHFGPMHAYAPLPFFCILVAYMLNDGILFKNKLFKVALYAYMFTAIAVDWHHWFCAYHSSQYGRIMSEKVIQRTEGHPQKVLSIELEDDSPRRYSSFCLPPKNVFNNGTAVRHYSGYKFPSRLTKETAKNRNEALGYIDKYKGEGYEYAWIVYKDSVEVIDLRN